MTIIMRASWNGLEQGTIQNLGATEEARLIAAGIAADHTATAAQQIRGDAVVTRDNRIVVRDDTAGGLGQVVGGGDTPETINNRDGLGRVTSYTLGGVTYTVTYGNNGPATISGGGVTRTFNYNAAGFLTGYTDA